MSKENQYSILYGTIGALIMSMVYWGMIIFCYMNYGMGRVYFIVTISQIILYIILENVSYRRHNINNVLWGAILFIATMLFSAIFAMCVANMMNYEAAKLLVYHGGVCGVLFVLHMLRVTTNKNSDVTIWGAFMGKIQSLRMNWVDGIIIAIIILARILVFEGVWIYADWQEEIMDAPQWEQYMLAEYQYENGGRNTFFYSPPRISCKYILMFDWNRSKCVEKLKEELYTELDGLRDTTPCLDNYDVNENLWEVTLYSDSMDMEENSQELNKIYHYCCLIRRMEKGCFGGKPREVNVRPGM